MGNNTPVFFIRDPQKFPDFIHTQKRHPKSNLRSNTAAWDFWSLSPESLHQVTISMFDRGLPVGFRNINGYGSHTYSLINEEGERFWVKFHFKTKQGIKNYTNKEAAEVVGKCRENSQRDLFEAIEKGDFPKWSFEIQIMTNAQAKECPFNPFDLTKVWPHADYQMIKVGEMELNENPENYFQQVEQASFSPSNIVPGISWSPDKMLQARVFSYADAHRYRVGTHYEMLPINRPIVETNTYHMDGSMNLATPKSSDTYYEPNSFEGPVEDKRYVEPPFPTNGDGYRYDHREGNDDFSQPRALFNLMSDDQKAQLFSNISDVMEGVPEEIVQRQLSLFEKVSPDYAEGVKKALGK